MILPVINTEYSADIPVTEYATRTYRVNFDLRPATGMIDGAEAMKQSIFCMLQTERFRHLIYSWNYGVEIYDKIGHIPDELMLSQIKKTICQCLEQDDRILEVTDFRFTRLRGDVAVMFRVSTKVGNIYSALKWWGDGYSVRDVNHPRIWTDPDEITSEELQAMLDSVFGQGE